MTLPNYAMPLLRAAGFSDVQVKTLSRVIRFDDGEPFLRLNTMAFVGMSSAGKALSDEERKRIVEAIIGESVPVLQQYSDGPRLAVELRANLATAKKGAA